MSSPRYHSRFQSLMDAAVIRAEEAGSAATWAAASVALLRAMGDLRTGLNLMMAMGDDDDES